MTLVNPLKAKLNAGKAVEGCWVNIRAFFSLSFVLSPSKS